MRVTDLSRTDTPFVVIDKKELVSGGYLVIKDELAEGLPWIPNSASLSKLTLKLDVYFNGKPILVRYVHFDQFFEMEYTKIALRIANCFIQTEKLKSAKAARNLLTRFGKNQQYFSLRPSQNEICQILEDLAEFKIHLRDV